MPNYENSKIYKLVSKNVSHDLVYIGSTTRDLRERLAEHKQAYNIWVKKNYKWMTSFKLFEMGDVDIILIEDVDCENKHQLHSRERYWIENLNCVNKCIPCRTRQEYYKDNRDDKLKYQLNYNKTYYIKNKQKISEYNREYRKKNREKFNEYHRKYYANKKSSQVQQIDC